MKIIYLVLIHFFIGMTLIAQDGDFTVSDSYVVFKDGNAPAFTLLLQNKGSSDISVGAISIVGAHDDEFGIVNDGCSSTTLGSDTHCNIGVKFTPKNNGIKNALLHIPYDSKFLSVFLTNYEDNAHDVKKRLPPVIYSIINTEEMNASISYTIQWSLTGYHDSYKTKVVIFDCSGITNGACGSSYSNSEKFLESSFLTYSSKEDANWTYRGQHSSSFNYTYTTTIPANRANGDDWNASGTDAVIRFYVLSDDDEKNNKTSLSLMIPGNISHRYYDTSGRKMEVTICPSGGCQ